MDKAALLTLAGAAIFRFLECVVKVYQTTGKFDIVAIIKEYLSIS